MQLWLKLPLVICSNSLVNMTCIRMWQCDMCSTLFMIRNLHLPSLNINKARDPDYNINIDIMVTYSHHWVGADTWTEQSRDQTTHGLIEETKLSSSVSQISFIFTLTLVTIILILSAEFRSLSYLIINYRLKKIIQ